MGLSIKEQKDGRTEWRIIAGMICDNKILSAIAARHKPNKPLFSSEWANLVAGWCLEHHKKHKEAPRKGINAYYQDWEEQQRDRAVVNLVDGFLTAVDKEYRYSINMTPELILDSANKYFRKVQAIRAIRDAEIALDAGQLDKAETILSQFTRVDLASTSTGIDLFLDEKRILEAFAKDEDEAFIPYDGALGQFFKPILRRGGFVAVLAPDKTGKSFFLQDIAFRAMTQRLRVAYFEAGDLTEEDVIHRFGVRAAQHPDISPTGEWPCTIKIPISIKPPKLRSKSYDDADVEPDEDDLYAIPEFKTKTFNGPLKGPRALRAMKKVQELRVRSKKSYFKMECAPNNTISVSEIVAHLDTWEMAQDWVPDVVIVDYADILIHPQAHRVDRRDETNEIWKELRRLSQAKNCLVVTATQADADSYNKKLLDRRNFSEDKRKNAHVTSTIAINMTAAEKARQVMRLNIIVNRKGAYDTRKCVYVAGCLDISEPMLCSTWGYMPEEKTNGTKSNPKKRVQTH